MKEVKFIADDGKTIFCSLWDNVKKPIGVVQIIHGMDEHVRRYDRFAKFLNKNGYIVFGDDHRAHGRTAGSISNIGKPNGEKDLFAATASDETAINKFLYKKYKLPVLIFGHSYGSFITQRIIENDNLPAVGVCLSGSAKYPLFFLVPAVTVAFIGQTLFGPNAPARFIEYFSPIRGESNGSSKLTRDKKQAKIHDADPIRARYFSYGFYYAMFKNLIKLSGRVKLRLPVLIISGGKDLVSMNALMAKKLYKTYKLHDVKNLQIIIYPGAKHELLMETNYEQVQKDILHFFNSLIHTNYKKK